MIGSILAITDLILQKWQHFIGKQNRNYLDNQEALFLNLNKEGRVTTHMVVFMSCNKPLPIENIIWALRQLMFIHPLLRARVGCYANRMYWQDMDTIEPEVKTNDTSDWHEVYWKSTLENFRYEDGPLWRCTYIPNAKHEYGDERFENHPAFVFAFCHAIIDGEGRIKLMNEFQDLLSASLDSNHDGFSISKIKMHNEKKVPPKYSDLINPMLTIKERFLIFLLSFETFKRRGVQAFLQRFGGRDPFTQCVGLVSDTDPTIERKTCIYPIVIESDDAKIIFRGCKAQKVSVQSVMQTAATISICEIILEAAKQKGIAIESIVNSNVSCTGNLRQALPEFPWKDVSYVATLLYIISCDVNVTEYAEGADKFWQLASRTMTKLHTNRVENMKKILYFMNVMHDQAKHWPNSVAALLSFTNLGNCNYLNRDDPNVGLKITGHYSATAEHDGGPLFSNSIVTLDNRIFWGAGYYPNVTSRDMAARYLNRAKELLLYNCKNVL